MATITWSTTAAGDYTFDPQADQFIIDDGIAAADIIIDSDGTDTFFTFEGKTITLLATPMYSLTDTNVTFTDGSTLLVGDNDTSLANDNGANSLAGGAGDDFLLGGGGNDTLEGGDGGDLLIGENGDDSILGGLGNDTIDGLRGVDSLIGGDGNDRYVVDVIDEVGLALEDEVVENADEGIDTLELVFFGDPGDPGPFSYTLGDNIENLLLYDAASAQDDTTWDWNGTGNALDNFIAGNGGENSLSGGDGNDTLDGAGGNDVLSGGDGDDSASGGAGNDTIHGSEGHDVSLGGDGNDLFVSIVTEANGLRTDAIQRFEGGAGADSMSAGMNGGFDFGVTIIAEYRNDPGGIVVNLDQQNGTQLIVDVGFGLETIEAGTARDGYDDIDTLKIPSFGPNLAIVVDGVVGSMHDDYIRGGTFSNSIGGETKQIFEGLAGDDTIIGGFDYGGAWISYESSIAGVVVNLSNGAIDLGADTQDGIDVIEAHSAWDGYGDTDTFEQIDRVRGSQHNDTLIGGFDDEEHLEGLGGDDYIDGGHHWDNAYYTHAGEGVLVHLGAGVSGIAHALDGVDDSGTIGEDELVEIEAAHGSDFDDSIVGGGDGAQLDEFPGEVIEQWEIQVFEGNEELGGQAGNDTIDGGDAGLGGRDTALYRNSPDAVIVNLSGADLLGTIYGTVASNTAADGYGDTDILIDIDGAEGSRFNDLLVGGTGSEFFIGRQGHDTIDGGDGIDWASYDFGTGVVVNLNGASFGTATEFQGGPGGFTWTDRLYDIENVIGSNGNDTIIGNSEDNVLVGFEGNDLIAGDGTVGGGNDTLYGGEGDDVLRQGRGNDSINGGADNDRLEFVSNGINYLAGNFVVVDLGAGTSNADGANTVAGSDVATLLGIDRVHGTPGADRLTGGSLAHSPSGIFVEAFRGNVGNDTIDGTGTGNSGRGFLDRVDYSYATVGVNVNLVTGVGNAGAA